MSLKFLELLAEHGGILAVVLGVPYVTLLVAVGVLWKNTLKDKERLMLIIENKVAQDAKLQAAFSSL
jgi:hypothetical protein